MYILTFENNYSTHSGIGIDEFVLWVSLCWEVLVAMTGCIH